MKVSISRAALAVSALIFAIPASAQSAAVPSPTVALKAITYVGCYSDSQPLEDQGPYTWQSPGYCQKVCAVLNKPVMATQKGSNCWCGDKLPSTSAKTSESDCNSQCNGFTQDICGGQNAWSVSLDGLLDNVDTFSGSDSGSTASSTSGSSTSGTKTTASPSVITEAGQTIVVTASGNSKATSQSSSAGPSKAGIAAGVVAGVLVICAVVGGLFFFLRARKRESVEEAYRRNAAINQFVQGGKKQTSEGSSVSDSRLDPSIMVQRRMSDGSIADNQDYSRRILKVANPDNPRGI